MLERIAVTMPSAFATGAVFRLRNGEAAERDCSCGCNCKSISFHSFCSVWCFCQALLRLVHN